MSSATFPAALPGTLSEAVESFTGSPALWYAAGTATAFSAVGFAVLPPKPGTPSSQKR